MCTDEQALQIDTEEIRSAQRRKYADLFVLADQCTSLSLQLSKSISTPLNRKRSVMALYLYRCISHYRASTSLAEGGMTIESFAIARGLLETTFVMLAIAEDAVSPQELAQHDEGARRKHANALLKSNDYPNIVAYEQQLRDFVEEKEGSSTIDMREFARRGNALAVYDGLYRHLSHQASHPSLSAIDDYLSKETDGKLRLHFRPLIDKTPAALLSAAAGILLACFACEKVDIKISGTDRSIQATWSEYEQLYEKHQPWAQ